MAGWETAAGAGRLLAALFLVLVSLPIVQSAQPVELPRFSPRHFVFMVDCSFSMADRADKTRATLGEMVRTGWNGRMTKGDVIHVWTFNEQVYTGVFRARRWDPEISESLAREAMTLLAATRFEKQTRMDRAAARIVGAAGTAGHAVFLVLSDGDTPLRGTRVDGEINAEFRLKRREAKRLKDTVVAWLEFQRGELLGWDVELGNALLKAGPPAVAATPTANLPTAPTAPERPAARAAAVGPPHATTPVTSSAPSVSPQPAAAPATPVVSNQPAPQPTIPTPVPEPPPAKPVERATVPPALPVVPAPSTASEPKPSVTAAPPEPVPAAEVESPVKPPSPAERPTTPGLPVAIAEVKPAEKPAPATSPGPPEPVAKAPEPTVSESRRAPEPVASKTPPPVSEPTEIALPVPPQSDPSPAFSSQLPVASLATPPPAPSTKELPPTAETTTPRVQAVELSAPLPIPPEIATPKTDPPPPQALATPIVPQPASRRSFYLAGLLLAIAAACVIMVWMRRPKTTPSRSLISQSLDPRKRPPAGSS